MAAEIQIQGETVVMELQKPRPPYQTKMTLEQFIDFCDSHKQPDVLMNHLKEIIRMHSFKLIKKSVPKDELVEAVRSLNLMEPARTTLHKDDVSSGEFITLQEVIKDLSNLKWQECCIVSLQNLNTAVHYNLQPLTTTANSTVTSISSRKSKSQSVSSSNSKKKSSAAAVTKCSGKKQLGRPEMEPGSGEVDDKRRKKIKSISS